MFKKCCCCFFKKESANVQIPPTTNLTAEVELMETKIAEYMASPDLETGTALANEIACVHTKLEHAITKKNTEYAKTPTQYHLV